MTIALSRNPGVNAFLGSITASTGAVDYNQLMQQAAQQGLSLTRGKLWNIELMKDLATGWLHPLPEARAMEFLADRNLRSWPGQILLREDSNPSTDSKALSALLYVRDTVRSGTYSNIAGNVFHMEYVLPRSATAFAKSAEAREQKQPIDVKKLLDTFNIGSAERPRLILLRAAGKTPFELSESETQVLLTILLGAADNVPTYQTHSQRLRKTERNSRVSDSPSAFKSAVSRLRSALNGAGYSEAGEVLTYDAKSRKYALNPLVLSQLRRMSAG